MKTFTVEQAKRALSYVRPICDELRTAYLRFLQLRDSLSIKEGPTGAERDELIDELDVVKNAVILHCDELERVGVQVKRMEEGLIDFPYKRQDGQVVLLCWKLGEETVEHWHDTESGFTGRQPLDNLETAPVSASQT